MRVLTVDGKERKFRLKMDGLKAFARAVREALGKGPPESMREEWHARAPKIL
jgi:hypothetical protein